MNENQDKNFLPVTCNHCGKTYNAVLFYCSFCGHASEDAYALENLWNGWPLIAAFELAYGERPENWPLPAGQSLSWREWAEALNAEAIKRGHQPERWPMPEHIIKNGNCFTSDWVEGKSVKTVIDEQIE